MFRFVVPTILLLSRWLPGLETLAANDAVPPTPARADLYGDPLPDGALARLGTVRYRGCAGSGRIEFLGDGQTLLGCNHGHVLWLDAPTGRIVLDVDTEAQTSTLLAVTRDRSLAAVGTYQFLKADHDEQYGVTFFDTTSGEVRSRLQFRGSDHRKNVTAAAFTPDARRLITGDYDGVLRIWTVATGREELAEALPSPRDVQSIDVSADGKWIVSANYQAAYRWAWQTDRPMQQFGQPDERVLSAVCAPDAGLVALGSDSRGSIRLFDLESGRPTQQLSAPGHQYYAEQVAFTSDGKRLAAPAYPGGELDVWSVEAGELLQSTHFGDGLRHVAISPDDRLVAASTYEGTVAVWDLESGTRVGGDYFGHLQPFGTVAVSPAGDLVATAGNDGMAILWDPGTGKALHVLQHKPGRMVRGLTFSPDGTLVATSALDDTVVIWNCSTGERVHTLVGHGELGGRRAVRFSPDGRRLLSFGDDWFLRAFNVQTGKAELEHALRPSGLKFKENADGTVNRDDERMFDMLPAADFTVDGRSLLMAVGNGTYVFDVSSGEERTRLESGRMDDQIAVSPDGIHFCTLRQDSGVETPLLGGGTRFESSRAYAVDIRSVQTGDIEHTLNIPAEFAVTMAISPDGSRLALSGKTIQVFDTASGRELARIELPVRAVWGVSFLPDGRRLLVTHADTTAMIWDWEHFRLPEEPKP